MTRSSALLSKQRSMTAMVASLLPSTCKRSPPLQEIGCLLKDYKCCMSNASNAPRSPSGSPSGSLQRGKACIFCRRRKMKCDGVRPICGPCSRLTRPEDCEYTDNQGRTQTERLEERLAHLQARVHELENPDEYQQPVFLQDPHAARPSTGEDYSQIGDFTGISPHTSLELDFLDFMSSATDAQLGVVLPPYQPMPSTGFGSIRYIAENVGEPNAESSKVLVTAFLQHAAQLGFALNQRIFLESVLLPIDHPSRPHPALINSVYLWSSRLTQTNEVTVMEPIYLSRAIRALSDIVGKPGNPQRRVQGIQAEILLALYFFYVGRLLEGRYHAAAAMSLAVSCRLHKIGTPPSLPTGSGLPSLVLPLESFNLPPALNVVQEGERINLFWTVFVMDRCWSVGVGSSVILSEAASSTGEIITAWPVDMAEYEQGNINTNETGSDTLMALLNSDFALHTGISSLTLRAKASALFEHATQICSRHSSKTIVLNKEAESLQVLIQKFIASLSTMSPGRSLSDDDRRHFIVTLTLAHASIIQLHNVLADLVPTSYFLCLQAAREAVHLLDHIIGDDLRFLDPFIGVTWLSASRVLLREIVQAKNPIVGYPSSIVDIRVVQAEFNRLQNVMDQFGRFSPLIAYQADSVRQMKEAIDNPQITVSGSIGEF